MEDEAGTVGEFKPEEETYIEGITLDELKLINLTHDIAQQVTIISQAETTSPTFNAVKITNALRDIQLEVWAQVGLRLISQQLAKPEIVEYMAEKYPPKEPVDPVDVLPEGFGQYL